ncbi:hypothetical protein ACFYOV_15360 [Streptomyces sp. NPDC005931]|uniref:hypothetical protein n=1 Tax=Streptomyces sp. NPDC005931 TaxID=3364737 RepID=UPI0036B55EF4
MDRDRRWGVPLAGNLVLGVVAVLPLWLLMMFLANDPLTELGLASGEPADRGAGLSPAVALAVAWALFLAVWLPFNLRSRPRTGASAARYWTLSAGLAVTPMAVVAGLSFLVDG